MLSIDILIHFSSTRSTNPCDIAVNDTADPLAVRCLFLRCFIVMIGGASLFDLHISVQTCTESWDHKGFTTRMVAKEEQSPNTPLPTCTAFVDDRIVTLNKEEQL